MCIDVYLKQNKTIYIYRERERESPLFFFHRWWTTLYTTFHLILALISNIIYCKSLLISLRSCSLIFLKWLLSALLWGYTSLSNHSTEERHLDFSNILVSKKNASMNNLGGMWFSIYSFILTKIFILKSDILISKLFLRVQDILKINLFLYMQSTSQIRKN